MFYFGSPEDSASLYFTDLESRPDWPSIPRKPVDEMSEDELAVVITYLNVSWGEARSTGASEAILQVIQEQYDEAFELMCQASRDFRKFVHTVEFTCPGVDRYSAKSRYRAISLSYMTR